MKLYLMRHPPVHAKAGLCYGQLDLPLATSVKPWVEKLARQLPLPQLQVFCSDLQRCRYLAEAFHSFQESPLLREINFGLWEGKLWQDLPREETEYWTEDVLQRRPPQGESFSDVIQRAATVRMWMDSLACDALLITHAGFIRAFLVETGVMEVEEALALPIAFGEIFEVHSHPHWHWESLEECE